MLLLLLLLLFLLLLSLLSYYHRRRRTRRKTTKISKKKKKKKKKKRTKENPRFLPPFSCHQNFLSVAFFSDENDSHSHHYHYHHHHHKICSSSLKNFFRRRLYYSGSLSSTILLCNFGALLFSFVCGFSVLFLRAWIKIWCVFCAARFNIRLKRKGIFIKVTWPKKAQKKTLFLVIFIHHRHKGFLREIKNNVVPGVFLFEEQRRLYGNDDRETPPSRETSSSSSPRRSEDTVVGFNVFFRQ